LRGEQRFLSHGSEAFRPGHIGQIAKRFGGTDPREFPDGSEILAGKQKREARETESALPVESSCQVAEHGVRERRADVSCAVDRGG
jgi:hypothetical protein